MIYVVIGLVILLVFIASIPAGEKCPKCEKHYTSHYKAKAKRIDTEKPVLLEFSHCHYCHHKWNISEDGIPVDEQGNPL